MVKASIGNSFWDSPVAQYSADLGFYFNTCSPVRPFLCGLCPDLCPVLCPIWPPSYVLPSVCPVLSSPSVPAVFCALSSALNLLSHSPVTCVLSFVKCPLPATRPGRMSFWLESTDMVRLPSRMGGRWGVKGVGESKEPILKPYVWNSAVGCLNKQ